MTTYEGDLLYYVDSVDVFVSIFGEGAVGHHGVLLASVNVIDRDDHWIVVLNCASQLKGGHVVGVKCDLSLRNFLVKASCHLHVCDVIAAVRSVEHFRGVVWVLFLGDAHVDTDVGVTQGVVFECD